MAEQFIGWNPDRRRRGRSAGKRKNPNPIFKHVAPGDFYTQGRGGPRNPGASSVSAGPNPVPYRRRRSR